MCKTCDYKRYVEHEKIDNRGKSTIILKNDDIELDIWCDITGKNYKIGNFTTYNCPTCGKKLYQQHLKAQF